jgi:2-polyprenyl-3-methyl-5-hydroxy-6-metoxy-1,4-benzoquinol methylase
MKLGTTLKGVTGKRMNDRNLILKEIIKNHKFDTVLDLGCGIGDLFINLDLLGIKYNGTGVDFLPISEVQSDKFKYIQCNINEWKSDEKYDFVISSHVIEHNPDTESFLNNFFSHTKEGGIFCIIWPNPKYSIVGGHVHIFNMGLMLYNIIRTGIDCSNIRMYKSGYNLCIVGEVKRFTLPELTFNRHEIEILEKYFPFPAVHGFDGNTPPGMKILNK